jgi:hypothetical protein
MRTGVVSQASPVIVIGGEKKIEGRKEALVRKEKAKTH